LPTALQKLEFFIKSDDSTMKKEGFLYTCTRKP